MAYGVRPVPQNIMSVEFKLFDFMTVKQFMFGFGLLLVSAGLMFVLPSPWKFLVPITLVFVGGFLIFVPYNGDPFLVFLASYLEAMISPQRRVWYRKGLLVKSAYVAAKKYQFGDDMSEDDLNDFKFKQMQYQMSQQETVLDKEEQKFLVSTGPVDTTTLKPKELASNTSKIENAQQNVIQNFQQADDPMQGVRTEIEKELKKTVGELNQIMPPAKRTSEEDDEISVRNFIFGNVEGLDGKTIANAIVTVIQNGINLEVIITNQGGDFITKREYRDGQYTLNVKIGSEEFNEVTIQHDPIDPVPVVIHHKNYIPIEQRETAVQTEESINESGVFEGAYNSNFFNIGTDYSELEAADKNNDTNPSTTPSKSTELSLQNLKSNPVGQSVESTKAQLMSAPTAVSLPNTLQLDQIQKQKTSTIQPVVASTPAKPQTAVIPSVQNNSSQEMSGFKYIKDTDHIEPKDVMFADKVGTSSANNDSLPDVATRAPMPNVVQVPTYAFADMPNSRAFFDPTFSSLPNTINGEVFDKNGALLTGVVINVIDQSGAIVRTIASNAEGKFYSFSSLPYGQFHVSITKDGVSFPNIIVNMDGGVIPAKAIVSLS